MHISIFVYGTWGDIRPHVVLGQALQETGHRVQVIASPGYEAWVRARNLDFFPLKADVNTFTRENAAVMDVGILKQLKFAREFMHPIFTQMGLDVLEATRESDVLMTVEFGAALLLDVLRVNRLKTILLNPAPLNPTREFTLAMPPAPGWLPFKQGYNRFTYSMLQRISWSVVGGPRNEIASKHLSQPKSKLKDYQKFLATTPALTTVSKHVLQRPPDWAEHHQVTGYLFDDDTDWQPPQALTEFLAAGKPPVYIGFGSMPDSKPQQTTRMIVDAVNQSGQRAVILSGWAGLGADDAPDHIYFLKYAPHSWLFPQVAAVVHHGGAGTTAAGFAAGKPTCITPFNGDQPYWGRRVRELQIGTPAIPRKKLTSDNLAAAIRELTSNHTIQQNAHVLGEKIRAEDGLQENLRWAQRFLA